MQLWKGVAEVPARIGASVVTLGNFDGVHRGHRAVLGVVVDAATSRGLTSVAVTFHPHPIAVLFPDRAPAELTSLAQRLDLLSATGLDAVLVLEFTREFAGQTPAEFVDSVFVGALQAAVVVVGEDTRFGVRNSGTVQTLVDLRDGRGEIEVQSCSLPVRMVKVEGFRQKVVRFTTDIPYLTKWGKPLLLGPGSILDAHTKDEFVLKKDLDEAVRLYEDLAKKLLGA